jgi:hypothetical protein
MTIVKSLKVERGFHHRVHRSKKNRKYVLPKDLLGRQRRRQKLAKLKEADMLRQLKRIK